MLEIVIKYELLASKKETNKKGYLSAVKVKWRLHISSKLVRWDIGYFVMQNNVKERIEQIVMLAVYSRVC